MGRGLVHDQILLMTRPRRDAERFVAGLAPELLKGVRVLYAPLLEIVRTAPNPDLTGMAGVIFSSGNAVALMSDGGGAPCFCVGARTAAKAREKGFRVDVTARDAQDLVTRMIALEPAAPLVHISGAHRRGDIAHHLSQAGITTQVAEIYDQRLLPLSSEGQTALAGDLPVILPLFSPRTAVHLADQILPARGTTAIALSSTVAAALGDAVFRDIQIAAQPTGKDMVVAIEKQLRQNTLS